MSLQTLRENHNLFLTMQNRFNYEICEQLFDKLASHLYNKWTYSDRNMLFFLTRLDEENKDKILKWGLTLLNDDFMII